MGSIDAAITTPRFFRTLKSKEGDEIPVSDDLKKDADLLMTAISEFLTSQEMEPLAMVGHFDIEAQADMILWENATLMQAGV